MKCEACGREIAPERSRARFCPGSRCRTDAWVRRKQREARAPLERVLVGLPGRLEELAAEIREALGGREG